ncbi:unnamed protein product [Heterosigma akashiwo]
MQCCALASLAWPDQMADSSAPHAQNSKLSTRLLSSTFEEQQQLWQNATSPEIKREARCRRRDCNAEGRGRITIFCWLLELLAGVEE